MDSLSVLDSRRDAFFSRAFSLALGRLFSRRAGPLDARLRSLRLLSRLGRAQRRQAKKREAAAREGRTVPAILISSITRRCNLDCAGCYSKALREGAGKELETGRFLELFKEAAELGVGTLLLAGGEPLLRRDLLEGAAALPDVACAVFTNGSLIDDAWLDLFASGAAFPVFSIEGDAAFTEGRRGAGVHETVLAATRSLQARGALFGFSVTLSSANADAVLSDRFLAELAELGTALLVIVEYVPVAAGTDGLVLRPEQKAKLDEVDRRRRLPFLTLSLPGDEEAFGGCLAAGRGFVHLADDGALEACPFAPYSDANAAAGSLREALDSPLMKAIRERHGELTETRGGCALWNKKGWVASLSACGTKA